MVHAIYQTELAQLGLLSPGYKTRMLRFARARIRGVLESVSRVFQRNAQFDIIVCFLAPPVFGVFLRFRPNFASSILKWVLGRRGRGGRQ